jgi:mRNA interferase HigB
MRVIAKKTLKQFWKKHSQSEQALKAWYAEAKVANWHTTSDIKLKYKSADFLHDNKVIFNICGNKYRLIVKINFAYKIVFIKFIETHSEYNKIKAEKV